MEEVFKDIPGYDGLYQVSNYGRVKSLKFIKYGKVKLLKPGFDPAGYLVINLFIKKIQKSYKVHQLVAITFLNHKPCGLKLVVNHIDHNRSNNRVDNLEIVTHRQNVSWRKKKGTSKYPGVCWNKAAKKFTAQIRINGKNKYLGAFKNEYEAAEAYRDATLKFDIKINTNKN